VRVGEQKHRLSQRHCTCPWLAVYCIRSDNWSATHVLLAPHVVLFFTCVTVFDAEDRPCLFLLFPCHMAIPSEPITASACRVHRCAQTDSTGV
jgi:hypothetical protein